MGLPSHQDHKARSNSTAVYVRNRPETTFNGVALKEKRRDEKVFPASGFYWEVQLTPGPDQLSVSGRTAGLETASDDLEIHFSDQAYGKAVDIRMSATPAANGQILIEAVIVDNNGLRVHSASERIYLSHTNPGSGGYLLKDHGTPDKSAVIEAANGKASILFEPDGGGSGAIIEARTQTLNGSYIRLP